MLVGLEVGVSIKAGELPDIPAPRLGGIEIEEVSKRLNSASAISTLWAETTAVR